jgi:hypothetical protein
LRWLVAVLAGIVAVNDAYSLAVLVVAMTRR